MIHPALAFVLGFACCAAIWWITCAEDRDL
jgi:hypothetical protein